MAEIKIAELNIDVNSLIKATSEVKQALDSLREEQKRLQKSGQESSAQFVANASSLKVLGSEYNSGIKAIAGYTQATADQANRVQLLELALKSEVTTIAEARSQNSLLNKLRNDVNVTTAEGKKELDELNEKLDSNNEFIKENADQYLKQKINIGNYSESIKEALNNLNPFNGGISGFIERSKEAGGVGNLLKTSLGGIGQGILGVTKASLAFIATPIGAVIAVIGLALGALYKYLTSTQKGIDLVTSVTRPLMAIFSALGSVVSGLGEKMVKAFENPKKTLADLGEFVKQNLINRFKVFAVILEGIIELDFKKVTNGVLQAGTGVENLTSKIANGAKEANKFISDAVDKGRQIDELNKTVARQQLEYNRTQIKTNDLIDEQLLKSKDTSLTFAERGKAANEIIRLTEDLGKKEEDIIQKKIRSLQLEYELKGVKNLTNEETQAMIDLETQLDDAQDRGLNARLDQTRVLSGLKKEQQDQARKAEADEKARKQKELDDIVKLTESEVAFYKETNRFKEDDIERAKEFAAKDLDILKSQLAAKQLTKKEYDTAELALQNDLKEKEKEIEEAEIVKIKDFEQRKKDLKNEIALKNVVDEEAKAFLKLTQDLEKDTLEIESLKFSIEQKDELKLQLAEKYNKDFAAIAERGAAKQAKIIADASAVEINYNKTKNEALLSLAGQLSQQLLGLLGDSVGAQIAAIALDAVLQIVKLNIATSAAAAVNTANGVALSIPTAGASVAAATATNVAMFANSKLQQGLIVGSAALAAGAKITSKNSKFAGGGFVGIDGNSHDMGGVPIYAGNKYVGEAQGQEGIAIMNRGAFSAFKNFNNTYGDGDVSTGGFYAGGGIITQAVSRESINVNDILGATLEAFAQIPAPIVLVEDINMGQNNVAQVRNGANF